MKRILFLNVPSLTIEERKNADTSSLWNSFQMPIGVLSIISYCKASSRGTEYDFFVEDLRECYYSYESDNEARKQTELYVLKLIRQYSPNYIMISALFNTCHFHLDYIEEAIKQSKTSAVVVIGGGYATTQWKHIFKEFPRFDLISIAEGEIAICAILSAEDHLDEIYLEHCSIVTHKSFERSIEPHPEFVMNLDDIPPLDFSLIHNQIYKKKHIIFNTSRGCPFECVFCAAHLMAGKQIRFYSTERVISEFSRYLEMGYRDFAIFDENFLFNKKRALQILTFMKDHSSGDISISFPSGVMVARVDEELCDLLTALNVKDVPLALESGSDRVLKDIIRKPLKLDDFKKAVQTLKKYSIEQHVFIVSGLPGETDEDRKMTADLLKEVGITWASFNLAMPLIGSRLHKICEDNGYFYDHNSEKNRRWGEASIELPEYSASYLKETVYRMNLDVNFINNYSIRCGQFSSALDRFQHINASYHNHAFALFMMALCNYCMERPEWRSNFNQYSIILENDELWQKRAEYFSIPKRVADFEQYCKSVKNGVI